MASRARFNPWVAAGGGIGLARFRHSRGLGAAGALLGVLALLLQAWLPLVHPPAIAASLDWPAGLSKGLSLCLAGGPARSGAPAKMPAGKPASCPICQSLHLIGGFVPPAGAVLVAAASPPAAVDAIATAPITARASDPTAQPRAPPVAI